MKKKLQEQQLRELEYLAQRNLLSFQEIQNIAFPIVREVKITSLDIFPLDCSERRKIKIGDDTKEPWKSMYEYLRALGY